jgi:hypothetical protein
MEDPLTQIQHGRNGIPRYEAARLITWKCQMDVEVCPVRAGFQQQDSCGRHVTTGLLVSGRSAVRIRSPAPGQRACRAICAARREPKSYAPRYGRVSSAPSRARRRRDLLRCDQEPVCRCCLARLRVGREAEQAQGHRPHQAGSQGQAQDTALRARPRPADHFHLHRPAVGG